MLALALPAKAWAGNGDSTRGPAGRCTATASAESAHAHVLDERDQGQPALPTHQDMPAKKRRSGDWLPAQPRPAPSPLIAATPADADTARLASARTRFLQAAVALPMPSPLTQQPPGQAPPRA